MKKTLFLLVFFLLSNVCFAQEILQEMLIFNAEQYVKSISIEKTEAENLKKQLEPLVRESLSEDESCKPVFSLRDVKNGAFTRAAAEQKAYLYQYCETLPGSYNQGVVITEQGKLIANILFDSTGVYHLKKLADINQNGRDELLLSGGFTGQGTTLGWISILEISDKVHSFGHVQVSEDGEYSGRKSITNYYSKIYVQTGKIPRFFQDKTEKTLKLNKKTDKYEMINIKTTKHQVLKLEKEEANMYELTLFAQ